MIQQRLPCYKVKKWANMWGKVGLVGLSPKTPQYIEDYRTVIEGLSSHNQTYTIFPKDAVENRGSVSVLLRDTFEGYKPECLPTALFMGNRGLRGSLRATHVKTYGKNDKTRGGASKEGWRLVILQGCPDFMRSLEAFDDDQRFSLGSGYIYIRGGVRKSKSTSSRPTQGPARGRTGSSGRRASSSGNNNNNEHNTTENGFPRPRSNGPGGRRGGAEDGNASNRGAPTWGGRAAGPNRGRSTPWGVE